MKSYEIDYNNEFALNMEDVFMVKSDNSCATKIGHFYLLLTFTYNLIKGEEGFKDWNFRKFGKIFDLAVKITNE